MSKVDRVAELLETRLGRGDYALRPMPAEADLAAEAGVSRMTARKAVLRLIDAGLVKRGPDRRLVPAAGSRPARGRHIGFLAPATRSTQIDRWRAAAERAAAAVGAELRAVDFHHWQDPVLTEAAGHFDGMFLVPPAEPVPAAVARRLAGGRARVVVLDADLTGHGLRSIDLVPPASVGRLLDHLAELGHTSVACLNTQPFDGVVEQRIDQWKRWGGRTLLNAPTPSYGDPVGRGRDVIARRLARGRPAWTALFCVTLPAAVGAMRAAFDAGLRVGRDLSICAANDEGLAAFLCPSLTATRMPNPVPPLTAAARWMAGGAPPRSMLVRPSRVPLFVGESTGRPAALA